MMIASFDDWERFRHTVKNLNRYVFCPSILDAAETGFKYISNEEFLRWLLDSLKKQDRSLKLEKDTALWRAQLDGTPYRPPPGILVEDDGCEVAIPDFQCRAFLKAHDSARMIPYSDKAKEGRINPKGIPCLYAATNLRIALSEMKPMIGSYLTLAEFATLRELRIVDFASKPIELADPVGGPTDDEMVSLVWEEINDAFSEPVTDSDNIADYAPTQIVAELFRRAGYDGIRYKSKCVEFESLQPRGSAERSEESQRAQHTDGSNIALFDLASAQFKSSKLYRFAVTELGCFDFRQVNTLVCAGSLGLIRRPIAPAFGERTPPITVVSETVGYSRRYRYLPLTGRFRSAPPHGCQRPLPAMAQTFGASENRHC
jgi:RES domain